MPSLPNFNNFNYKNSQKDEWELSYGAQRALRIGALTLRKLIEHQNSFKEILNQVKKLRIINQDKISRELLSKIEEECTKHLPEAE